MQKINTTLIDILDRRKPLENIGITFVVKSDREEFLSYKELYNSALKALSSFQDQGLEPGDELVFQIEDNRTFIIAFWACILGGIIPVPLSLGKNEDHKQKLLNTWLVLNNPYLIISEHNAERLKLFGAQTGTQIVVSRMVARRIDENKILTSENFGLVFNAQSNDTAFIQFSSGSTGNPKGVVLTHRNLITNMDAIAVASRYVVEDIMLSWMPLTHDMGLIGFHLSPLYCGMNHYILPTTLFIRRPDLWLRKASEHKISILCSPNFGYEYTLKHGNLAIESDCDLSNVRIIYNGAEPISDKLCHRFLDAYAKHSLNRAVMCPVYGLAEASLAVSISQLGEHVKTIHVDRNKLKIGDKISIGDNNENAHHVSFVNVGKSIDHCSIRISDDKETVVGNEIVGHIQIKGDNVTPGYYNNETDTNAVITDDGWLKTGDVGFIKEGSLFITGRAKDIFFVNGLNYYPQDIEKIAQDIPDIELNKIAVAGVFNDETQQEEVIAFVFHRGELREFIPVKKMLAALISIKAGLEIARILPVNDIPRTTSGKLQRFKLVDRYKQGKFDAIEAELNLLLEEEYQAEIETKCNAENEVEKRLLDIWKRVLKNDSIKVTERFFELGGNSLRAAEMGMMILREFQVELSFETIYQHQSIRSLAEEIGKHEKVNYNAIPKSLERQYYNVSSAQKRLYYLWNINRSFTAYNIPVAFHINGRLAIDILENSINQVVERHDLLRSSFVLKDKPMFQVESSIRLYLDFVRCKRDELFENLRQLVRPFDLEEAPLFRIKVLEIDSFEYVLWVDFHHIISDGLSVHNFMEELFSLYNGEILPAPPVQFKDYEYWETQHLKSERNESQKKYWRETLAGILPLPVLDLPLDFARPPIFNTEGRKVEFSINKISTRQLRKLARENDASLHALMFALYYLLLVKYTGQQDLIIGIPVSGRTHPDTLNMQGMFVNNLAIRNALKGNQSFIELLDDIKTTLTAAFINQDCPFEDVLNTLELQRDVSRNVLFDTMFIYQNMGMPPNSNSDFVVSRLFFDPGFSKFDISCEVFDDEDEIKYNFEYATGLFRTETIARLATYFNALIKDVIADPNRGVFEFRLIEDIDLNVKRFNATEKCYPADKTIHQLVEEQITKTPESIALEYRNETLTYAQLGAKVNAVASALRQKGIVPGTVVGILLTRTPDLVISILAVLNAGGCYVPIDPELPFERISFIISNSECKLVICEPNDRRFIINNLSAIPVVGVNDLQQVADKPIMLPGGVTSDGLAYIIYTSGTAGDPKGVMISHKSVVNYIIWAANTYVRNSVEAAFALYTSISFDLTVTSIFVPLVTGNKIVIYDTEQSDLLINAIIADNKVNIIKLTPSHLKILAYDNFTKSVANSKLKTFIVGGEKFDSQLAIDIERKFGSIIEIYNEYGPTEATVGCMIHKYNQRNATSLSVSIGKPIDNMQIYLLDHYLQPVPPGVKGEIFISGDGIAKGYVGNDALTEKKFLQNPFIKNAKMYETGDLGIRRAGEDIEYLGRIDNQVKVNGHRIELGEIESCLVRNLNIKEAVVIKHSDDGREYICAYYVKELGKQATTDELRSFLSLRLPLYMIPGYFIELPEIPLTLNGKIDARKLPLPTSEHTGLCGAANELEQVLVEVWRDVLNRADFNTKDNFLSLGGDSIKAVQISSRLFEKDISLNPKDILVYQSIAQILLNGKVTQATNQYDQGLLTGYKKLSAIEEWFFKHNFENRNYYNQSILLNIKLEVSPHHIRETFSKLIEHHDGLRLNYDDRAESLFFSAADDPFDLPIYDYSNLEEINVQTEIIDTCETIRKSINIGQGSLLRAALFKRKHECDLLFITVHHLAIDGISWRILLDDIKSSYLGIVNGKEVVLPRKTASLRDWYNTMIEYSTSDGLTSQVEYWQNIEEQIISQRRSLQSIGSSKRATAELSKEQTSVLNNDAVKLFNADVQSILLTALTLVLEDWSTMPKPVIELEHHGRTMENIDVSRTVGWFTSIYPIQLKISRNDGVKQQILSVRDQINSVPHNGLGYNILKYINCALPSDIQNSVRFNFLGDFDRELNNELFLLSDFHTGSEQSSDNVATADIEINCMIVKNKLKIEVLYNISIYDQLKITGLMDAFTAHLDKIGVYVEEHIRNVHLTPADFDAVALDQDDLNLIFNN